jgi:hypothetical protein
LRAVDGPAFRRSSSAQRSTVIVTVVLVGSAGMSGMIDASTTYSPSTPCTLPI